MSLNRRKHFEVGANDHENAAGETRRSKITAEAIEFKGIVSS